jgi:predicted nucleotidyltransferase component of viral defense system
MPIIDRLSDVGQKQKAMLQDRAVEAIFSSTVRAVFHGGTAVWRCYGGERFSKDIDIYVKNLPALAKILNRLEASGIRQSLAQERKADFGLYRNYILRSALSDIALQVTFAKIKGSVVAYETSNGSYRNVVSLTAEELLLEKLDAFLDRSKARDLYDMWILSRQKMSKKAAEAVAKKLAKPSRVLDYEELRHTVYGALPEVEEMKETIMGRANEIRG